MSPQRRLLLVLVTAAIVVVLFFIFRSASDDETTATTAARTTTAATTTGQPAVTSPTTRKTIVIRIVGGKPVGGVERATVQQGDTVRLVVHSDVADEVHVHGYDLGQDVAAGGTATITFKAKIAGGFEAELESRSLQILELTVTP